ncbi:MAG: hypothetical protein NDF54_10780 [archaeon GB-1867-035]|nr:hypothetical protein [Candidatus Culexmicrobium profundum]
MRNEEEFGLEEVLKQLKKEISQAMALPGKPEITIKKCILELSTVATKTAEGKIKLKILPIKVGGGAELSEEMIQKVILTMIPTPPRRKIARRKIPEFGIVRVVKEVRNVIKIIERTPPPFRLEDFKVEVKFGITRKGGVGKGISIWVIEAGAEAEYSKGSIHKLTIHFGLIQP